MPLAPEQGPAASSNVATTALWVAHMRAEEAKRKKPLIHDPLAEELAGKEGAEFAEKYADVASKCTGKIFDPVTRAKFIEDLIVSNNAKIKQIVLLGAGMDTRAFRMKELSKDTTIFEVDFAHGFTRKDEVLDRHKPSLCCNRVVCMVALTARAMIQYPFSCFTFSLIHVEVTLTCDHTSTSPLVSHLFIYHGNIISLMCSLYLV